MDLILSLFLAVPTLVVLILLYFPVTADGGLLFFKQERVGKDGKMFTIYKIRTMREGEITRIGLILRKFRIDELPQIANILIGDMSFVGPRPRPREEELLLTAKIPDYARRAGVIPGVTGWAQIRVGRVDPNEMDNIRETVFFEGRHLNERGIVQEYLTVLTLTVLVILWGRGQ